MKFKAISLNRRTESPIKHVQNAPRFRSKHEQFSGVLSAVQQEFTRQDERTIMGRIREAQKEIGHYTSLIVRESALNKELRLSIEQLQAKTETMLMSGLKRENDNQHSLQKQLRRHEIEFQKITQKVNELKANINSLKQHISHAREERVIYSNIFKNLQKELFLEEEQLRQLILVKRDLLDPAIASDSHHVQESREGEADSVKDAALASQTQATFKLDRKKESFAETVPKKQEETEFRHSSKLLEENKELLKVVKVLGYNDVKTFLSEAQILDRASEELFERHQALNDQLAELQEQLRLSEALIEKSHKVKLEHMPASQQEIGLVEEHAQSQAALEEQWRMHEEEFGKLRRMLRELTPLFKQVGVPVPTQPLSLQEFEEAMKQTEAKVLALIAEPAERVEDRQSLGTTQFDKNAHYLQNTLQRLANERQEEGIIGKQEMEKQGLEEMAKLRNLKKFRQLRKTKYKQ